MKIYVVFSLPDTEQDTIKKALLPDEQCVFAQSLPESERLEAFLGSEVVFGNIRPDWIEKNKRLRWIQLYSTGFDAYIKLDWENALLSVRVTNLRGFFGQPVAETAVAGIMALYRKIDELARLQAQQKWVGGALRPSMELLHQKNVLILGAGAIGDTTRKLLEGFSCSVKVISRSSSPSITDLDALLPQADIVIVCLPDTPQTRGIINKSRFDRMKKGTILVNVGRGSAVDEDALLEALRHNWLGGAILDVTSQEPLPTDHPLWKVPNVLLTQHTGGGFREENADKVRVFLDNLNRYRRGEPLANIVNFMSEY